MQEWQTRNSKILRNLLIVMAWLVLGTSTLPVHAGTPTMKTTVTLIMTDTQGNVLMTTDVHGNILARYTYRSYGTQQSGPTNAGPGYTGHVNDPDTGLVYMQQRYYDPVIKRFISPDPVGPAAGNIFSFNRYAYANNNPVRYTDSDGRNATAFIGGLFVEGWHGITGQGFNGAAVVSALKDGYNGEGRGVLHAALQDASTLSTVVGVAGAVKGASVLIGRLVAKKAIKEGAEIGAKGLGNPFKEKSAAEVEKMFKGKGFEAKGGDPLNGKGGYVNPKTGRSYHIDPKSQGKYREPNHVDVNRPRGYKGALEKKKLPYKDDL